jgi:RNA polymerase sigma factor (sigma-70 family)
VNKNNESRSSDDELHASLHALLHDGDFGTDEPADDDTLRDDISRILGRTGLGPPDSPAESPSSSQDSAQAAEPSVDQRDKDQDLVYSMSTQEIPSPPSGFEKFYRNAYRSLMRDAIFVGGNTHEAEEAVSMAMVEVLQRWETIENPRAYARRAVIRNLIEDRKRKQQSHERLIQLSQGPPEHYLDPGLTVWEQKEWVTQFLNSLPPAQREVVACLVDMLTLREIALLLGKTEAAVLKNLSEVRRRLADYLAENNIAEKAQ